MKKISWITQEGFIDVDIPVIRYLKEWFMIKLIIVMPNGKTIDYDDFITSILGNFENVDINYCVLKRRARSLKNIKDYYDIISAAKGFAPDLYYISFTGMPYGLPLLWAMLPLRKCVMPCHNVSTPKGATNEKFANIYKNLSLKIFNNVQVFSEGQQKVLLSKNSNKNVLLSYLMLKDYGEPSVNKTNDAIIKFLFFGNIVKYKRLDLLIEAVNILAKRGLDNFRLTIAGKSKEWKEYQSKIEFPELINTRIERIPNEDVANLFAENHYFVMPYQDIAQSGAITVAFKYNVPTIVSDIPQFKEFVIDGKTSLSFKSEDSNSLADTMQYAIEHHHEIFESLCKNQKALVSAKFSDDAIVKKYKDYFEGIMSQNE